jgi:hypothetical protein
MFCLVTEPICLLCSFSRLSSNIISINFGSFHNVMQSHYKNRLEFISVLVDLRGEISVRAQIRVEGGHSIC